MLVLLLSLCSDAVQRIRSSRSVLNTYAIWSMLEKIYDVITIDSIVHIYCSLRLAVHSQPVHSLFHYMNLLVFWHICDARNKEPCWLIFFAFSNLNGERIGNSTIYKLL